MKYFSSIILAVALAVPALAEDSKTNSVAGTKVPFFVIKDPANSNLMSSTTVYLNGFFPDQLFPASAATLTAPLVLTNDYLCLTNDGMAEVAGGGKAVFTFSVTNAGNYIIEGLANGPDDNSNSFFVNVDTAPDADMIWDIESGDGFDKHVVSWRGSGDATTPEFAPKIFKLEPGDHKIILVGREPGTLLKSLTLRLAPLTPAASPAKP